MQQTMASTIVKYQGVAPQKVITAVANAAKRTGADFSYLMEKAATESSFNPKASAKTSSAKGLFQFIESTWLGMVKTYGAKYGLGKEAAQIEIKDGKPCVNNCAVKQKILSLRQDPQIAALMAGEYSAENKSYLEKNTRCDIGPTEMYLAHFMGPNGAARFLNAYEENPNASAAKILPEAARANKGVFYDRHTGRAKTLDEIYNRFANKFDDQDRRAVPSSTAHTTLPTTAPVAPVDASLPSPDVAQQALLLLASASTPDEHGIIWDTPASYNIPERPLPSGDIRLSSQTLMTLAELTQDTRPSYFGVRKTKDGYNA